MRLYQAMNAPSSTTGGFVGDTSPSYQTTEVSYLLRSYGPPTVLGVSLIANLVLLLLTTRRLGFFHDDFLFILDKRGWSASTFLAPIYGHLALLPVATYKLLFLIVGIHHSWPYRFVAAVIDSTCAVVLYLLIARHAGRVIALVPAILLLMLGAGTGSTDLIWIASISFLLSLAAGMAAFLYLDREDTTGDRIATALLVVSIASSGTGLALCVGALVYLLVTHAPRPRYRVVLVPLALYAIWYMAYMGSGSQGVAPSNLLRLPDYLVQIASAGFSALLGLSGQTSEVGSGAALLLLTLLVLGVRAWRGRPFPPLAAAGIAGALTFWMLVALARGQSDGASNSRYLYPSAVFILLTIGGMMSWRKATPQGVALAACLLLFAGVGNLNVLLANVRGRTKLDDQVRVVLGAAEMIGHAGKSSLRPDPPKVHYLTLGAYLTAVHQLGSPAFSPTQITTQPEASRALADKTIIDGEQIGIEAPPSLVGATPPTVENTEGITTTTTTHADATCLTTTPTTTSAALDLTVTPGHSLYLAPSHTDAVTLYARRLAATYPQQPLGTLPASDGPRGLGFPVDASTLPWHIRLVPTTALLICQGSV